MAVCSLLLSACYKEIDLEQYRPKPTLVLNCVCSPDTVVRASVSRTVFFTDHREDDPTLTDATVSLTVNGVPTGTMRYDEASKLYVSDVVPQAGDRIVEIDGHRLWSPQDLTYLLSRSDDGVFDFVVERDGETVELPGVHFATEEVDGITLVHYDFSVVGEEPNFGNVFVHAFTESASVVRTVWLSIFDLVTGRYGLSQLAGPIGTMDIISDVTASAAAEGRAGDLLMLLAFITINLGVANLLPLPALDGGRLLFLVLEGIRRKPIPAKYEGYVHAAGMALLLLLMLVVSLNDILRIARG